MSELRGTDRLEGHIRSRYLEKMMAIAVDPVLFLSLSQAMFKFDHQKNSVVAKT